MALASAEVSSWRCRRSRQISYGGGCGYQNPRSQVVPVEDVWRFSLDFTFSAVGTESCQYLNLLFSVSVKANPRPHRAAQAVAEAAHVQLPESCQRPWTWTSFSMIVSCDQCTLGFLLHNMAKFTLCYLFSSSVFCKSRLDMFLGLDAH